MRGGGDVVRYTPPRPVWLTVCIVVAIVCAIVVVCTLFYGVFLGARESAQRMTPDQWFRTAWFVAAYLFLMALSRIKDELKEIARHLRELKEKVNRA